MARIILVNRYFSPDESGSSRLTSGLAFHLAEMGVDVQVITSRSLYFAGEEALPRREMVNDVAVQRIGSARASGKSVAWLLYDYLSFHLSVLFHLLVNTRREDLCIVATDPPMLSVTVAMAAVVKRFRRINWIFDLFPDVAEALYPSRFPVWLGKLLGWLRNRSFKSSAHVVATCEQMKGRLVAQGLPETMVAVVHNWADDDDARPIPPDQNPLRSEWGLAGRFVVAYTGNLGPVHDARTLLSAALALRDDERFLFLFMGDGYRSGEALDFVASHQLGNVVFKPHPSPGERMQALALPDVHVVTLIAGLEEMLLPGKFYWGVATGRPTIFIGSKNSDIARLLASSESGFTVSPGNAPGVVDLLLQLRGDREYCSQLGRNARLLIDQQYSRSIALAGWRHVLKNKCGFQFAVAD